MPTFVDPQDMRDVGVWRKLEISVPELPVQDLADLINKLKEFVNAIATLLDVLLQIFQAFADPLVEAIRALLAAIREAVESLLEDAGAYILYVPIRKRLATNFMIGGDALGDVTPPIASELGIFAQPQSAIDWDDPNAVKFLVNSNRVNGGNVGYYKTVIESLYDTGDVARPQFTSENDWIGGLTLLMGTNVDLFGFLDDLQKLRELFGFSVDSGTTPKVPAPKNLRGRALGRPSGGKVDVFLQWDPVEVPIVKLTDLGGVSLYPKEVAIIRVRNDVEALRARSIEDLIGTDQIAVGDKFGVFTDDPLTAALYRSAEVLSLHNYNFTDVVYLDKNVEINADETVYYAVAWKLGALTGGDELPDFTGPENADAEDDPRDFWQISNVARVVPSPTLPDSTPPNWHRTPALADLIPPLARVLRLIVAEIDKIGERLASSLDLLSDYVDFLRSEVNRYEAIVQRILDVIAEMTLKLQAPTAGIYARGWIGKGGNTYLMTDMASSLSEGYDSSPPFHEGDEYVTGVVMLTGGPRPAVESFTTGLELLFGTQISGSIDNLLENAEEELENIESIQFGEDMEVTKEDFKPEFTNDFSETYEKDYAEQLPETVVFSDALTVERVVS